jgi:hypothetical protein
MKKSIIFCAAMLLMFFVRVNTVHAQAAKTDKTTMTGEIVDMDCYMSGGMHGADHKSCAAKCIANGIPMGLLTKDGKVYVLTAPHENQDPYNKLKKQAAETVTITGEVFTRGGVQSIQVDEVKM